MIIAERVLSLRGQSETIEIPVRIFSPEKAVNGNWFCRYEIGWPDKKSEMNVGGIDSAQALILALQMIGAEIYSSSYHRSGHLYVDKPGSGYGFPVAPTFREALQGDDKKYL